VSLPNLLFVSKISKAEAAREALIAFRTKHAKVFEEYDLLVNSYSSAVEEAKAEYKLHHEEIGKSYQGFSKKLTYEYDAERLLELMPNAEAAVDMVKTVNRKIFDDLVAKGLIPMEVVEEIKTLKSITITAPKVLGL
jgi:hypothetical protein